MGKTSLGQTNLSFLFIFSTRHISCGVEEIVDMNIRMRWAAEIPYPTKRVQGFSGEEDSKGKTIKTKYNSGTPRPFRKTHL